VTSRSRCLVGGLAPHHVAEAEAEAEAEADAEAEAEADADADAGAGVAGVVMATAVAGPASRSALVQWPGHDRVHRAR
jgi:hypothetical protein